MTLRWCGWKDAPCPIFIEVPAANGSRDDDCVLLYGHLDKQPG